MPSKGVDYYSYISVPNASVQFSGPKVGSTTTSSNNFQKHHLEIESANIDGSFKFTGRYQWNVILNGSLLASQYNDINTLNGNLEGGTMTKMLSTPMFVTPDYIVSFGFYDAGPGTAGLTNADQSWVCVTKNQSKWMESLAPPGSTAAQKPFTRFVLPGAHDAGMNTMQTTEYFTDGPDGIAVRAILAVLLPSPIGPAIAINADNIIMDNAITQKESITNMLQLGIRYFDFRPAYPLNQLKQFCGPGIYTLYHTHTLIPGISLDQFLHEIVAFLVSNVNEIVVVRIGGDGIIDDCPKPTADTLQQYYLAAIQNTNIKIGNSRNLGQAIDSIRSSSQRLIILYGDTRYDSYSGSAYATLTPAPIINQFMGMKTKGQTANGVDITVLQCQGTATSIAAVTAYAASFAGPSNSPLMETKATFDIQTLPWITTNALNNLQAEQNIVLLNDFVDGATCDVAIKLSAKRLA